MKCAICGIQIDSVDETVEEGWTRYFYDGETEHEVACPDCTRALLREGKDGEMEVKAEYRAKLNYLAESGDEGWQDHSEVVATVLEHEPGKLIRVRINNGRCSKDTSTPCNWKSYTTGARRLQRESSLETFSTQGRVRSEI